MKNFVLVLVIATVVSFGYTYNLSSANSKKIFEIREEKDDYHKRIDAIINKLDRIESCLSRVENRIGNNGK